MIVNFRQSKFLNLVIISFIFMILMNDSAVLNAKEISDANSLLGFIGLRFLNFIFIMTTFTMNQVHDDTITQSFDFQIIVDY